MDPDNGTPHRHLPGTSPGTLIEDPRAPEPVIRIFGFSPTEVRELRLGHVDEIRDHIGRYPVLWVNVDGLGDVEVVSRIGAIFELHSLSLEDVVSVHQRVKVDDYDDYLFLVTRMPSIVEDLKTEQLSMFLGPNFVITFQERVGDCLDQVRDRIRRGRSRIRTSGPDYLAYAILDAVVDAYFPILEHFGVDLEKIEDEILEELSPAEITRIHDMKSDLLELRRIVRSQRDVVHLLLRDETHLVREETRVYLRDCYDHSIRLIDVVQTNIELGSGLMELYLSLSSNRMNDVMRILTLISTIFIPLTFISSIYGMNFSHTDSPLNMPELRWYFGYPFSLCLMLGVALSLLVFFRRKKWI